MAIAFECICGQRFEVPDARAGRKARCSRCLTEITVPTSNEEAVATALPPRRRKRRSRDRQKPKLSKTNAEGLKVAPSLQAEMHPVLVIVIAGLLFLNGWQASNNLIYVPLITFWYTTISESSDGVAVEEIEDPENESAKASKVVLTFLVSIVVLGFGHLGLAASMAGILLWRGYAVYYAIACAVGLLLIDSLFFWDLSTVMCLNVPAVISIILMLKHLKPVAWPRLMATESI